MHLHLISVVLPALLTLSSSIQGAHSFSAFPHARRSFAIVKRQTGILGGLGNGVLGGSGILGGLGPTGNDQEGNTGGAPDATTKPPQLPSDSPATDSSPPLTPSPSSPTAVAPSPQNTGPAGGLGGALGGITSGLGGAVTGVLGVGGEVTSGLGGAVTSVLGVGGKGGDESSSVPSPTTSILDPVSVTLTSAPDSTITPPPVTSSKGGGILDGITSPLGGVLNPVTSVVSQVVDPVTSVVSQVIDPVTSAVSQVVDPVTSAVSQVLDPVTSAVSQVIDPVTSAVSQVINPVTSAVSQVIDPVTSAVSQVIDPVTSAVSQVVDPVTSAVSQVIDPVTSAVSQVVNPVTSAVSQVIDPVTSAVSQVVEPVTSAVSSIVQPVTSAVLPPITSVYSDVTSIVASEVSSITSILPPVTTTIINQPPISTLDPSSSSIPDTGSPTPTSDPAVSASGSDTSAITIPPTSIPSSQPSAGPTISFPVPSSSVSVSDGSAPPGTTVVSTSTATFSIDPGLSFVLTESSLAFSSVPTTAPAQTLTDPDQATTTVEVPPEAATTLVVPAALPTGIPARIFPRDTDLPGQDLSNFTLISILFNNELNWPFVVQTSLASSQIFAYVPVLISTALAIPSDQIKTYALQVYIPTTYHGPEDASQLGTTWLGYIPSEYVDTLAAQIKAKTSPFYTGVPAGVARDLADHVVSGYSLLSVPDPNNGSSGPASGGTTGAAEDNGKSRQDAIIGVVSALGAIALLVLVFLVYRSMKRRKQLAHRRLSDPPEEVLGARPAGREFDQDSVGGARRRSFYYAEDSLRGYEGQRDQLMQDVSPTTLNQRRNIVPSTISAPVLRGSTLNW